MNDAAHRRTTHHRDRAVDRLRTLTTGTALAGFVATGAFGALAAVTYSGASTANADSGATTTDGTTNDGTTTWLGTTDGTTSGSSQGQALTPTPTRAPTAVSPTRHAQVTSGGSGG